MNEERLQQLTERAAKATKLADELRLLNAADFHNFKQTLEYGLQVELFVAGKNALTERKETELEALLVEPKSAEPPPSLDMGVQHVPSHDKDFGFGAQ